MTKLEPYFLSVIEAGCDEAGRGCLAGPVVASAVILPKDFYHPLLNDSKQLSEKSRNILRPIIEENAIDWAVSFIDAQEIDELNILRASITAMHRALDQLKINPEHIIVDGNKFYPYPNISHKCFVKGDARFASIAAASVLSKTHRDEYMKNIAKEFPGYGWERNMGYPTKEHRQSIKNMGTTPYHRMSFTLLPEPTIF